MKITSLSQIDDAFSEWNYNTVMGESVRRINVAFGDSFSIFVYHDRANQHIKVDVIQALPHPERMDVLHAALFLYKLSLCFDYIVDDFNTDIDIIQQMMKKIPSKKDREFMLWYLPDEVEVSSVREPQAQMYQGATGCVYNSDAAHPFVLLDLAAMFVFYCNQWEGS